MLTVSEWLEAGRQRYAPREPVKPAIEASSSTSGLDRHELRRRAAAALGKRVPPAVAQSLPACVQYKADCAVLAAYCARGVQQDKARAALYRVEAQQRPPCA